tara:strand:- start:397 stop:504 length:108 start_codon:yes stop_codon:yes gene_type:complete
MEVVMVEVIKVMLVDLEDLVVVEADIVELVDPVIH